MKILIIEDEIHLLNEIVNYLHKEAVLCEVATNFLEAEQKLISFDYDVILLDINIPGGNGLNLLKQLKSNKLETGIIIISARNSLDDRISGLDLGADDYMAKPIHLAELNARINALWRRKKIKGNTLVEFAEIRIDTDSQEVIVLEQLLELTKKEYQLLLFFIINRNRLLTKETIAEHLWGDFMENADDFDFVYTHIKNLRKKLKLAGCPEYLKSVYGSGYKWH